MTNSLWPEECQECGEPQVPGWYVRYPLHDGNGNYYLGNYCPHCEALLFKSRPSGADGQLTEHLEHVATLDEDPPDDIEDVETF